VKTLNSKNLQFKNLCERYGVTITIAFLIFILSVIPGKTVEYMGMGNESYHIKGHFIAYILLCLGLYKSTESGKKGFIITMFYGALMEYLQRYIPGRAFEYKDILVNSFGALVGMGIIWKRSLILPKRLKSWLKN